MFVCFLSFILFVRYKLVFILMKTFEGPLIVKCAELSGDKRKNKEVVTK